MKPISLSTGRYALVLGLGAGIGAGLAARAGQTGNSGPWWVLFAISLAAMVLAAVATGFVMRFAASRFIQKASTRDRIAAGLTGTALVVLVLFGQKWIPGFSARTAAVVSIPLGLAAGFVLAELAVRVRSTGTLIAGVLFALFAFFLLRPDAPRGGAPGAGGDENELPPGTLAAIESGRAELLLDEAPVPAVVVIGWDGAAWKVLRPLLERGMLPHIARLLDGAAWSELGSMAPNWSPVIWTTIWTGKSPKEHGIRWFLEDQGHVIPGFQQPAELPATFPVQRFADLFFERRSVPVTTNMRRVKAVWNIANDTGIPVGLTNLLVSWPVEEVLGFEISGHMKFYPDLDGLVHPPEEQEATIRALLNNDWALEDAPGLIPTPWLANVYRSEVNLFRESLRLLEKNPAYLYIFYTHSLDSSQHRYWKYHAPDEFSFAVAEDGVETFGDVIEQNYVIYDRLLGEMMTAFPENTTYMIVSDHGITANKTLDRDIPAMAGLEEKPEVDPELVSGKHSKQDPGILILKGPGIEPGEVRDADVYDIAPTILALLGLPVPDDMAGRALEEVMTPSFLAAKPVLRSGTYEGASPRGSRAIATEHDDEMKERLRALGYID
ncbi:MAG: hypothetical protein HKN20_01100 [Gemmatimonadetes bacterium]|nr:hypothetical protein [Gemmatimonadota bacterium]